MELVTRTFDLARAFAETTANGNSIVSAGTELARWMSRECIMESEFDYFQGLTRDVTFPNQDGLKIRDGLLDAIPKFKRIGGLHLVQSGSIGRLLAFDPHYCYLVSTATVLLAYHDIPFTVSALCHMALDREARTYHGKSQLYPYDIRRTRLRPVMDKVVQSIALNVVNSGHDLGNLPFNFDGCCVHCISDATFAAAVMSIERLEGDVLIQCDHFLGDLFLWLLNHWQGELTLTIVGKIRYEKTREQSSRTLRFMVKKMCVMKRHYHESAIDNLRIVAIVDKLHEKELLNQDFKPRRPESKTRTGFYSADHAYTGPSHGLLGWGQGLLDRSSMADVHMTTQLIVRWLLALHLRPYRHKPQNLELRPIFDSPEKTDITFGRLLQRWPKIMNMKLGAPNQPSVVFQGSPDQYIEDGLQSTTVGTWVKCFPPLDALFTNISRQCRCDDCLEPLPIGYGKSGCVRQTALTAFSVFFAHAISDGFGAKDASGVIDVVDLASKVTDLFTELVLHRRVSWNAWFQMACAVTLGSGLHSDCKEDSEGASLVAAVQYGSLVAVATWVDMEKQQQLDGCFGFEVAEGQLSGISDDLAIVHTEQTTECSDDLTPSSLSQLEFDRIVATDYSSPKVELAIMRLSTTSFRLLTMVLDPPHIRMVDPAQVLWGLLNRRSFQCPSQDHQHTKVESVNDHTTIWTVTELLGGWDKESRAYMVNNDEDVGFDLEVATCNTHLKFNIAMALSPGGCLIIDSRLTCLAAARNVILHDTWTGWSTSRRIINLKIEESSLTKRW